MKILRVFLVGLLWLGASSEMLSSAQSQTCQVPSQFETIQAAIDDASCETIRIAAGIYTEKLFIGNQGPTRGVNLIGAGEGITILDGNEAFTVIWIATGTVAISDLTVQNGKSSNRGGLGGCIHLGIEGINPQSLILHVALSRVSIQDCQGENGGGIMMRGIFTPANTLALDQVTLQRNSAIIGAGIALTHSGPTPTRTSVTLNNVVFKDNHASREGGGIFANQSISLNNVTLERNSAEFGGGIFFGGDRRLNADPVLTMSQVAINANAAFEGGGVFVGALSQVEAVGVEFKGNTATRGAGLFNANDEVEIADTVLENNVASKEGGGIFNAEQAALVLANVSMLENTAADGGGLINAGRLNGHALNLRQNTALQSGGAIVNNAVLSLSGSTLAQNKADLGSGVFNRGEAFLLNSTLAQNAATTAGGAFFNEGSANLTLSFTTLDGSAAEFGGGIFNNGGTVSIKNSLLSNSRGGNCAFEISSLGHNLSSDASCIGSLVELTDLNNVDPLLDPEGLKANGGPTLTVALLADSPAIDAVPESACTDGEGNPVTTDQRGIQRPSGSGCDIGAYEAQGGGGNEG